MRETADGRKIFRDAGGRQGLNYHARMTKLRNVLGLVAAIIMILSSGAHSFLGWKALGAQLAETTAPADLIGGLRIGWEFGGGAMLTFGVIAATIFIRRLRGAAVDTLPALLTGVFYVAIGIWAMTASHYDPFFLIMIVPGAMLAAAAWPR